MYMYSKVVCSHSLPISISLFAKRCCSASPLALQQTCPAPLEISSSLLDHWFGRFKLSYGAGIPSFLETKTPVCIKFKWVQAFATKMLVIISIIKPLVVIISTKPPFSPVTLVFNLITLYLICWSQLDSNSPADLHPAICHGPRGFQILLDSKGE